MRAPAHVAAVADRYVTKSGDKLEPEETAFQHRLTKLSRFEARNFLHDLDVYVGPRGVRPGSSPDSLRREAKRQKALTALRVLRRMLGL